MAEKWDKELGCDQLNQCKGLVTDCFPKSYIHKQFQTAKREKIIISEKKNVASFISPLGVMTLRKSKKISQPDCGFDNLMAFTDLWIIWLTTVRSPKWRGGSGLSCFWHGKQKKKERGRTDLVKEPAEETCCCSCCYCGLGIMAGFLLLILYTTSFGLRITSILQNNGNYPSNLLSPNFEDLGRNKNIQLKWIT